MNEQKEKMNLGLYILCDKVELGPWSLPAYNALCVENILNASFTPPALTS